MTYKEGVVNAAIDGLKQGGFPAASSFRILFEKIYNAGYNQRAVEELEKDVRNHWDEKLIHDAWRESEAYAVPMTEEGEQSAKQRFQGFKKGWAYAKFHTEKGHVYMSESHES